MSLFAIEKVLWLKSGEGISAAGRIPETSEFFNDHFPNFPILPGVLALEILKQTAECYLRAANGMETQGYFLKQMEGIKFSLYLRPGNAWENQLKLVDEELDQTRWDGKLFHQGKVAVAAQFVLVPKFSYQDLQCHHQAG